MEAKLMKAVQYSSRGGGAAALKHVEVPIPSPGKSEVLLKLEAASLNPIDWKVQHGEIPFQPSKFPFIPCTDLAGEVVQVGSGVKDFKVGDRVMAYRGSFGGGGLAEYCVASENLTVALPPQVSAAEGASLNCAAITAYQALDTAGVNVDGSGPKKNILVTAASGGVGQFVVQLAKLRNAHVTATCGARNIDLVKSLGADEVVDYKTPQGAALQSPSGKKYDAVVHCAPATAWSTFQPNLSQYGKVVDCTPSLGAFGRVALQKLKFSKQRLVPLFSSPDRAIMENLVKLAKEGKLKTVIDSRYPLSKAEEAWAKSMSGHATGKIIVEP